MNVKSMLSFVKLKVEWAERREFLIIFAIK